MQCISCKNAELEPKELEAGLLVAGCATCGGALVSLMNYRYWLDKTHGEITATDVTVPDLPAEVPSVRACPKCSRLMTKYQVGPTTDHYLDLCSACDEAWLDKGEWQLLKQLDLQGKLPKIFTDAWQRNIRKARHEIALNERYQKILGAEDFARAHEFKQWLYQSAHKEDIKQYLAIAPE